MSKDAIKDQLDRGYLIFNGYTEGSPELHSRLDQVGYTSPVMTGLGDLLARVQRLRGAALGEHGDQRGATRSLNLLRDKVEAQISALTQTAGTIFADNIDARTTLGLETPHLSAQPPTGDGTPPEPPQPRRDQSLAGLLDRGRNLYGNALKYPELLAQLTAVNYPASRLQTELDEVNALGKADAVQEREKGEATASTADQTAALAELKQWITRFRGIVVPALKDQPEWLTELGLKPRGGKR